MAWRFAAVSTAEATFARMGNIARKIGEALRACGGAPILPACACTPVEASRTLPDVTVWMSQIVDVENRVLQFLR